MIVSVRFPVEGHIFPSQGGNNYSCILCKASDVHFQNLLMYNVGAVVQQILNNCVSMLNVDVSSGQHVEHFFNIPCS